jgi:hypothetical protein
VDPDRDLARVESFLRVIAEHASTCPVQDTLTVVFSPAGIVQNAIRPQR